MKENEDKWMIAVVILLLLTVGIFFAKSNIIYKKTNLKEALAASSGSGECYTNWDGINCASGFTRIKTGKLTVVTDGEIRKISGGSVVVSSGEAIFVDIIEGEDGIFVEETGYGTYITFGPSIAYCPIGAGDKICANIPDKTELATWGLVVEQSSFDCSICCKI